MGGYSLNLFRLFSSGALLLFALYCLIFDRTLPFSMPTAVLIVATVYLAVFPVKDMLSRFNRTLYKGRQFAKNYEKTPMLDEVEFQRMKKQYDRRAWYAMLFWLAFLAAVGGLYAVGVFDRAWIFFFFAFSDFCVYFAVFFGARFIGSSSGRAAAWNVEFLTGIAFFPIVFCFSYPVFIVSS